MCGIFGVITTSAMHPADKRSFLEQAMFAGTLRGRDGTGIFGVMRPPYTSSAERHSVAVPKASWARMAAPGPAFLADAAAKGFMSTVPSLFAAVGHNRAATKGRATTDNTHPFISGAITLVHNGTIHNHNKLSSKSAEVDSHYIAHALDEGTPEDVIKEIEGAFALVWYDSRSGYINLIRNSERPLHLGVSRVSNTLYIASEFEMLRWLASRIRITIDTYFQPDPGVLMRWHHAASTITPEMTKLELKRCTYNTTYSGATSAYAQWAHAYDDAYGSYCDDDSADYRPGRQPIERPAVITPPSAQPTTEVTPTTAPEQRQKKIPDSMLELLMDWSLTPDDRMLFVPLQVHSTRRNGRTIARLTGELGCAQVEASLHGLDSTLLGLGKAEPGQWVVKDHVWEVAPIGVRVLDDTKVEVICRLISTKVPDDFVPTYEHGEEALWLYEGEDIDASGVDTDDADDDAYDVASVQIGGPRCTSATELVDSISTENRQKAYVGVDGFVYPGLYNTKVSAQRFLDLTKGGCYDCGQPITFAMANAVSYRMIGNEHVANCGCSETMEVSNARAAVRV